METKNLTDNTKDQDLDHMNQIKKRSISISIKNIIAHLLLHHMILPDDIKRVTNTIKDHDQDHPDLIKEVIPLLISPRTVMAPRNLTIKKRWNRKEKKRKKNGSVRERKSLPIGLRNRMNSRFNRPLLAKTG